MSKLLPLATSSWDESEKKALQRVIDSDMYTMGEQVAIFEKRFCDHFNCEHAVMVNSGSSANLLMIAALFYTRSGALTRGDEILVPAVSWSTTYSPLIQYGLKLRFVDIDPETLNFDLNQLEAAITSRTKAILAVNLLGNPNDFQRISEIADRRGIVILEDNCEAMGATVQGKYCGTFGLMGTFSTFFSHHISTMEGGVIVTDNEELYHILLCLRAHGWTRNLPQSNQLSGEKSTDSFEESFKFLLPGYNLRPLEMSGALGAEQLKKLNAIVDGRRSNAKIFKQLFEQHPYLSIQAEHGVSSWFGFAFIVRENSGVQRKYLTQKLAEAGVDCRPIVAGNFVKNQMLKYANYEIFGQLRNAEHIDQNGFFVGNHHYDISEALHTIRQDILN